MKKVCISTGKAGLKCAVRCRIYKSSKNLNCRCEHIIKVISHRYGNGLPIRVASACDKKDQCASLHRKIS